MSEADKTEEKAEAALDPLHEHREAFQAFSDAWSEDRKRYVEDLKFSSGNQWHQEDLTARENDGRPALVVDKLNQYVRQVVNDSRQNRPGVKVRPVDDGADPETAEIYQGLIRHIEDRSNADTSYDTAFESAVRGGFGFFRIVREYAGKNTFNQELAVKRIRNPLTVLFDPDCQEPDGSDAKRVYIYEDIPEDDYEATYPDADKVDWSEDNKGDWFKDKTIRVAECYWVETEKQTMHMLADGTIASDDEVKQYEAETGNKPEILDSREFDQRIVKWAKFNGKEYLDGPKEEPGEWIPVIPVWGNELDIEGKVIHTGMIHAAKDPQRLYNYSRTAFAERLSKPGVYVAADGQVEGYEQDWDGTNKNVVLKRYSPLDVNGSALPPPRYDATDIPQALAQDMQISEHDIQGALGMYNASLGERSNEKSGKAIMARQREGDMASFHYHDNLARAIRHAGRILVDLIPKIYDTKRVVRILGLDGKAEMAQIDPMQPQAVQKMGAKAIYNLGVGTYDVSVSVGPSYTTQRQEAADAMSQMFQGNPQLMQVIGDLFFRHMDWPGADDIADRLKLMLPPPILEAEKQNAEQSPEVAQVVQQAQQAIQEREQALQQAVQTMQAMQGEIAKLQEAREQQEAEFILKSREIGVKEYDAETKRAQALAPAFDPAQIQALVVQTLADIFNQPAAPVEPPLGMMEAQPEMIPQGEVMPEMMEAPQQF